jgi:hypothetical protein
MLTPQNAMKQANWERVMPNIEEVSEASAGQRVASILWMASPPIHDWIPNQPQATSARMSAGRFAPLVPNEARQKTGNGIP